MEEGHDPLSAITISSLINDGTPSIETVPNGQEPHIGNIKPADHDKKDVKPIGTSGHQDQEALGAPKEAKNHKEIRRPLDGTNTNMVESTGAGIEDAVDRIAEEDEMGQEEGKGEAPESEGVNMEVDKPVLMELLTPELPNIDIVAVHDINESCEMAWVYSPLDYTRESLTWKYGMTGEEAVETRTDDRTVAVDSRHNNGNRTSLEGPSHLSADGIDIPQMMKSSTASISGIKGDLNEDDVGNHKGNVNLPVEKPLFELEDTQFCGLKMTTGITPHKRLGYEDRIMRSSGHTHSHGPSSSVNQPYTSSKVSTWLTDPTMLAGRFDRGPPMIPPLKSHTQRANPRFKGRMVIDSEGLWEKFHSAAVEHHVSIVSFYKTGIARRHIEGVKFPTLHRNPRRPARLKGMFEGPRDPSYLKVVNELKAGLLIKASAYKGWDDLLTYFIDSNYNLAATDWRGRHALHYAAACVNDSAVRQLASAALATAPYLLSSQDKEGFTPLHLIVKQAVDSKPKQEDRYPFESIVDKLLKALEGCSDTGDLKERKDFYNKSAWEYAVDTEHWWVRARKTRNLRTGARAPRHEQPPVLFTPIGYFEQFACKKSEATLVQFYIANEENKDYIDEQQVPIFWLLYDLCYTFQRLFQQNLSRESCKKAACRWIHLPANNEQWIHDLFAQIRRTDKSMHGRRREDTSKASKGKRPESQGRSSYLSATAPVDENNKKGAIALFMPILGFEEHGNRQSLTSAMLKAITSNQFTYHMLNDTEQRDGSQVFFRWADKKQNLMNNGAPSLESLHEQERPEPPFTAGHPILMVDQLWLWILEDEATVITSFPNTWDSSSGYNLIRHILRNEVENNDNRPLIRSPLDLANLVVRGSVDFIRRQGPMEITLEECFQSSINDIVEAEKQATQFQRFNNLIQGLNERQVNQKDRADLTNSLFNLTEEAHSLAMIMRIQDELMTIKGVFLKQKEVLNQFLNLTNKHVQRQSAHDQDDAKSQLSEASESKDSDNTNLAQDNLNLVNSNIAAVEEMTRNEYDEVSWPIRQVMSLLFGISLGIISLIIAAILSADTVPKLLAKVRGKMRSLHKPSRGSCPDTGGGHGYDSNTDSDFDALYSQDHSDNISTRTGNLARELARKMTRKPAPNKSVFGNFINCHDYAPLFGRWHFHERIPLLRRFWRLDDSTSHRTPRHPLQRMKHNLYQGLVGLFLDPWVHRTYEGRVEPEGGEDGGAMPSEIRDPSLNTPVRGALTTPCAESGIDVSGQQRDDSTERNPSAAPFELDRGKLTWRRQAGRNSSGQQPDDMV
ncbi:hypothetical protein SLS62_008753 [Diatrype stigma]|uniref:Ankyrin repeat protein n=1 Tax=Diatrype stigma TaxID=117547 RepID=A0AAN9YMQ5_9PEZI